VKRLARRALGSERYAAVATAVTALGATFRRTARRRPRAMLESRDGLAPALRRFACPTGHTFFGYHDLTPFSADGRRLLALQATNSTAQPARVGWFQTDDPAHPFHPVAETETWCWQQGCRLRWHPSAPSDRILFNRLVDGRYGAVELDAHGGQLVQAYGLPLYAIDDTGRRGLSLDFGRLQRLRPGYGYELHEDLSRGDGAPADNGLFGVDLVDGSSSLLVSLKRLAELEPDPSMRDAEHYLNHASFSPDGRRVLLFHLWRSSGGRHSRMVTLDASGGDPTILSEDRASHYCWLANDRILAYTVSARAGGRFRCYTVGSDRVEVVDGDLQVEDGHPALAPDGHTIVVDTYPDRLSERRLSMFDLRTGRSRTIGHFYSPVGQQGDRRCDLHPRWCPSGLRVAIDSAHEGRRGLYVIDLAAGGLPR
jgi:hypothetical protein